MNALKLRVRAISHPLPEVLVAELEAADGSTLPAWTPGSHVELDLGEGMSRQYSLCGDAADLSTWHIAVRLRQQGGGGSQRIHQTFTAGHELTCRAVRNRMPMPEGDEIVFLAGGIGITPLIPMMRAAQAKAVAWRLIYTGREDTSMFALSELVAAFGDRVIPHFSAISGRIDVNASLEKFPAVTAVVACGPAGLMQAARDFATENGVACVTEAFDSSAAVAEVATAVSPDALADTGFIVELANTGGEVPVRPDQSVLSALEEAGVVVASSCREGYCGTCETVVVAGEIDHRDTVMMPEEHADTDLMMVCVSRCRTGRLVLEL
ncbi:PDR/VanB family oxidoreductase [Microbacterium sp. NPDC076911]|uniref:PDR/VanB family oxidoreductase n=1 Tax=Microbacterium sp. NPDC076911 TaxID=3154958 RepID=UPI003418192A